MQEENNNNDNKEEENIPIRKVKEIKVPTKKQIATVENNFLPRDSLELDRLTQQNTSLNSNSNEGIKEEENAIRIQKIPKMKKSVSISDVSLDFPNQPRFLDPSKKDQEEERMEKIDLENSPKERRVKEITVEKKENPLKKSFPKIKIHLIPEDKEKEDREEEEEEEEGQAKEEREVHEGQEEEKEGKEGKEDKEGLLKKEKKTPRFVKGHSRTKSTPSKTVESNLPTRKIDTTQQIGRLKKFSSSFIKGVKNLSSIITKENEVKPQTVGYKYENMDIYDTVDKNDGDLFSGNLILFFLFIF